LSSTCTIRRNNGIRFFWESKNNLTTVTIVTPSFNQARFLEQTIRSVLEQETPSLEYFVIDGGSTDSSVEIIKRYEGRLAGWVSEKDKGQADAINKGFRQAHGEIVAWLNSDDFYVPGAIARAVKAFEQNPDAGLVYGNVLSVDAKGETFNQQIFRQYNLLDLMSFQIISQPAVFIRHSMLEQAGLLDPSFHMLLDHHLWLRMARIAPIVYIPETLAAARYHAGAKNLTNTADFGREGFRIVEWMKSASEFSSVFEQNTPRILGGAHRFNAFYLLDGGQYRAALSEYRRAFKFYPPVALKEWHRVVYAVLALLGFARLRATYIQLRSIIKNRKS
jgi:glycosyltransferase involved in cell wall biosynthesis